MIKRLKTLQEIKKISIFTFERTSYVSFSDYCNIHKDYLGQGINVTPNDTDENYFDFKYKDKSGNNILISINKDCFV